MTYLSVPVFAVAKLTIQDFKTKKKLIKIKKKLKSNLIFHALDTDHDPDFETFGVLTSSVTNLCQRLFLE